MKARLSLVLFVALTLTAAVNSFGQQEFTFTTTLANINSSRARIDKIGLANNPNAIIVVTPLYDPIKTTQRSLGVWYYNNQWYFFNTDHSSMKEGLDFKMQIFLSPSANEFLHIISTQNLDGGFSVINHPQLNNNPNAMVKILQNHSDVRSPNKLNADEAQAIYDAPTGKWYIQNVNGTALSTYTAYNVVISSGGRSGGGPETVSIPKSTVTPKTILPNTSAGGDLSGNYPNPNVVGLYGKPLSSTQPKVGDTLRWDGTQWMPSGNTLEPLKFNPTLGKKIILYPGQTGDVGLSVQGNLLQIHSDNPNADVALGYDQAGTFNEKFRVKANGAIAVNGDTGQNGQVLTSNGANSPPTWKQSPAGGTGGLITYFKSGSTSPNGEFSGSQNFNATNLAHTIVLDKKSRLIISAAVGIWKKFCAVCGPATGVISVRVDNQEIIWGPSSTDIETGGFGSGVISNYMVDLNPGTHKIEIWVFKRNGSSDFAISQNYSSVMVIPIE